ncbi:MAG: APC family permease [Streptosporangiaceae bacterium]
MATSAEQPATQIVEADFEASDKDLRKTMKFSHLLFMSLSAIIGSGWLLGGLKAASVAGPAAIVSWIIGAILVLFIALTYAEISAMLPRSGSIARYPNLTHGSYFGWFMGWAYFLASVTVPAIEAEAVITYVGGQTDIGLTHTVNGVSGVMEWPNGVLFAIGLMILFFVLNFFGVRLLSEVNRWVTWWKIIIPSITAIFLFTIVHSSNFGALKGGFTPTGVSKIFLALATSGVFFAYLGFRQALDFAGEARNPQKDVPRATILCIFIAMVIYCGLEVAFVGAVNWHVAGLNPGDWTGLATSSWSGSPLYDALTAAGIGWLGTYAWFLLVDAGVSPSATGWVYLGATTRNVYGVSVHGFTPRLFQRMNRFGIPWISAIIAAIVGLLFMYPAPSWSDMVSLITGMTALTYIMGGVMLPILRKHAPNLPRPFRLPWAQFWAPVSFLAAMLVVYWGGYANNVELYGFAFIGLPIFVWYFAPRNGWFGTTAKKQLAVANGLVFLGAWCYIQDEGGYLLRISGPAPNSWGFMAYLIAQVADVAFFCLVLWLLAEAKGKRDVLSGIWVIAMLFGLLPIDYYGAFGPYKVPPIGFPWGTLLAIVVGLIAFYWGVAVGYNTEALQQITKKAEAAPVPAAS